MTDLRMTIDELEAFLAEAFPEVFPERDPEFRIASVEQGRAAVRFAAAAHHLRPGGTVSGPTLMTLADVTMYVLVLAHIGPVALAVTTNLNINFLRKPRPGPLVATARMLKLGRSLAVGDVTIAAETDPNVAVAHATLTYSIPPGAAG